MSAPWWHPEANPLRDIQEFIREQERQVLSLFSVPPMDVGPCDKVVYCPVDGLPRARCLVIWGHDPQHEGDIRAALRKEQLGG